MGDRLGSGLAYISGRRYYYLIARTVRACSYWEVVMDRFFTYVGAILMAIVGTAAGGVGVMIAVDGPYNDAVDAFVVGTITVLFAIIAGVLFWAAIALVLEQRMVEEQREQQRANLVRILEASRCDECESTEWGYCSTHHPLA